MNKKEFIEKGLILLDSSYQPQVDKSVYIYMDPTDDYSLWFILNDRDLYFSVFSDLDGLMTYILTGDHTQRHLQLDNKDMEAIDAEL
jgi:hypothetical protein